MTRISTSSNILVQLYTTVFFVSHFCVNGFSPSLENRFRERQQQLYNIYDDWRSDAVVDTMYLDEENIEQCLEEFIDSGGIRTAADGGSVNNTYNTLKLINDTMNQGV